MGEAKSPRRGALRAFARVAAFHGRSTSADRLTSDLALGGRTPGIEEVLRAAQLVELDVQIVDEPSRRRLSRLPVPAILLADDGTWLVLGTRVGVDTFNLFDPLGGELVELRVGEIASRGIRAAMVFAPKDERSPDQRQFGFSWFLTACRRHKGTILSVLVASFCVQLLNLVAPLTFQLVIDKVLLHKSYSTLLVVCSALVLIAVFTAVLKQLRAYALYHVSSRIDAELGSHLIRHLFSLPIDYFERRSAGSTVTKLREIETIRGFLTGQGIISFIDAIFTVILLGVLFIYSTFLALVFLGCVPLYFVVPLFVRPTFLRMVKIKFDRWSLSQQFIVESIVGMATIKSSGAETSMVDQWGKRFASYVKIAFESSTLGAAAQNAVEMLTKLSTAAILFFGAQEVLAQHMTVGGLIAFNMIANQVLQPVLRLTQLWQDYQQVQVSVNRLGDIMNEEPEPSLPDSVIPPSLALPIAFRQVDFAYGTSFEPVLKDIDLVIRPGETLGIVGASGSGKSTLAKLLFKFHEPTAGSIALGEHDLSHIDTKALRRRMGVVQQENILFNRTVAENITLGSTGLSKADAVAAAKLAGADEFIMKMPMRYDTRIEERGANLSGGQRQRIAIARALAQRPQILVFDEATSALDYESEQIIQTNMTEIVKGRTVIVIAHRLAAVRGCDRIVGMRDGRIVEIGTHDELMRDPAGLYRGLWNIQHASQYPRLVGNGTSPGGAGSVGQPSLRQNDAVDTGKQS